MTTGLHLPALESGEMSGSVVNRFETIFVAVLAVIWIPDGLLGLGLAALLRLAALTPTGTTPIGLAAVASVSLP
jgi:hypothetical protein